MSELKGRRIWVMAKGYSPDEGGMQTYARGVAEGYAALGAVVTVFTQTSAGPRRAVVGGLDVIDVGPGKSVTIPLRLLKEMRGQLRGGSRPDFIHATTWRTGLLPLLAGLPYRVTVHGREMSRMKGAGASVMRRVLLKAERVVAVSHYTRSQLVDRVPQTADRIVVAWNGISPNDHAPTARGNSIPRIFTLCRLEPRKNVAAAVRAAAACAARGHRFHYTIAGRGPDRDIIAGQIEAAGLGDRVTLAGFVSDFDAMQLYADADIFMHPQVALEDGRDFEGFGIAIADAMAAGAACIVGREGGSAELVDEGAGLVVEGRDDIAIEAALATLLADPVARQAMGERAASRATRLFNWQAHCRKVVGD